MNAPWFEDFAVGDDFSDVPSITLTDGHAAVHQAIFADRSRLPLDRLLSRQVTGQDAMLANPALVCNMAVGQTTIPSQRVMGNLFYRGLYFRKPVFIGDTLTVTTRCVGLRQNKIREGRAASGMVALEIDVMNQAGETVLHLWRCPMIPCRDEKADTGHADDFSVMPEEIADETLAGVVPDWDFNLARNQLPGRHGADYSAGEVIAVEAADTVTLAPELVRMTLNMAMTHTDSRRSVYGTRLVFGGHTIAMAAAHLSRAMPNLLSILAWYRCDHTAPVFEEDILETRVTVREVLPAKDGHIAKLNIEVFAHRGPNAPEAGEGIRVLDWDLAALLA